MVGYMPWKGISQEGGRVGDQKGDGFRISQTSFKLVHHMRDILLMIERSSERLPREQSSDRNRKEKLHTTLNGTRGP
jgi:hypothetical protein